MLLGAILLFHGLLPSGYAQDADAAAPPVNSTIEAKTYSVSGTVVNSVTGEPVRRAAVQISGPTERLTLTDSAGHFEFDKLQEGRVVVMLIKPGFVGSATAPSEQTTLNVAPDASPVVLKMAPAGVILGHVTGRDEQPLEGLQVQLATKQNFDGRQTWLDHVFQTVTDERGDFRIGNLSAGTYYLAVDQSQETTLAQPGVPNGREQGYAKVFYPGLSDFAAAAPLELRAGQQLVANFSLTPEPFYQISGLMNAHENGLASLMFSRKAGEGYDLIEAAEQQDGSFHAKLPPGSYIVTAFSANGMQFATPGAYVVISSDSPDVQIPLSRMASIPVQVQTERVAGSPQPVAEGQIGLPPMALHLSSAEAFPRPPHWWRPALPEIQNVEPGVYTVEINPVAPWWVKAAHCGSVDLLSDNLTVINGAQPSPIEITLRDDAASVSGTVVSAENSQQVTVLLVQTHGHRNLVATAVAVEGKFQFNGVPPGDSALLAVNHAEQLEYKNPEVLTPYLSKATHINLQPYGTSTVSLTLIPIGQ